jgi:hypothetical protein
MNKNRLESSIGLDDPFTKICLTLFEYQYFENIQFQIALANYPKTIADHRPNLIRKMVAAIWPYDADIKFFNQFEKFENLLIPEFCTKLPVSSMCR